MMGKSKTLRTDKIAAAVPVLEAFWSRRDTTVEQMDAGLRELELTDRELRYLKANMPVRLPQTVQAHRIEQARQTLELIAITNEDR